MDDLKILPIVFKSTHLVTHLLFALYLDYILSQSTIKIYCVEIFSNLPEQYTKYTLIPWPILPPTGQTLSLQVNKNITK